MLVAALISVCLVASPTSCERHMLRVEPRVCAIGSFKAEAPLNGAWVAAVARITCERRPA